MNGGNMSRTMQTVLVVAAVVITAPLWASLVWSALTPFGAAEALTVVLVVVLVAVFVASRVRSRRASALAEDGQRPGGTVDV